jgi:LysM repeat protein
MEAYIVQSGDTLGTIAAKFLGDSQRWREIADANPQITNVNLIKVGESLVIPSSQQGQMSQNQFAFPSLIPSAQASTGASASSTGTSFMTKIKELAQNKTLLIGVGAALLALLYLQSRRTKK